MVARQLSKAIRQSLIPCSEINSGLFHAGWQMADTILARHQLIAITGHPKVNFLPDPWNQWQVEKRCQQKQQGDSPRNRPERSKPRCGPSSARVYKVHLFQKPVRLKGRIHGWNTCGVAGIAKIDGPEPVQFFQDCHAALAQWAQPIEKNQWFGGFRHQKLPWITLNNSSLLRRK